MDAVQRLDDNRFPRKLKIESSPRKYPERKGRYGTISRNGDLVSTMFLEVTLKKSSGASYYPAENFLKEVELEIGGQRIDKHYSDWYRIYDELFRSSDEKAAYRRLVDFDTPTAGVETGVVKKFYVPLIFFFNKTPGLALPLIALQYHEVKLNFTLATAAEMALNGVDTAYTPSASLYVTYVFLKSGNESDVATFASGSHTSARSSNCSGNSSNINGYEAGCESIQWHSGICGTVTTPLNTATISSQVLF